MARYQSPSTMDEIEKSGIRIGWGDMSFDDLITSFDISKFPDYQNMAEPYIGYIIMSRPDMNMLNKNGTTSNRNIDILRNHQMTAAFVNDKYGYKLFESLCATNALGQANKNMYLPIITTRAMSYNTNDVQIKTIDKGNTYFGHMIKYGKHSEEHKVSGTISLDFRNDRFLSIMKMVYIWMCYIYIVSKTGAIEPLLKYQENGVLDYAASLYYLVVRRDARELVYWEKLTGVFPTSNQFSQFSFSDEMILRDRVSVDFAYGMRSDPNDPSVLMDLNYLTGWTQSEMQTRLKVTNLSNVPASATFADNLFNTFGINNLAFASSLESPFALGNSLAVCPVVHTYVTGSGDKRTIQYYLDWIKKE